MSAKWVTPAFFFESILLYSLGLGMAKYLGTTLHWDRAWLGILWVICLQLAGLFLWRHHLRVNGPRERGQLRTPPFSRELGIAIAALASGASVTVLMIANRLYRVEVLWVTLLAVLGTLIVSRSIYIAEAERFRELVLSFLMATLIPWMGFLLQTGEMHRLLPMITLPLLALRVAMLLSYQLSTYAGDLNAKKQTLLLRIGWQNGMSLHNALIVFAFFWIALAILLGMPLSVGLPPLAASVLGLGQIWSMKRIAQGSKPNWRGLVWGGAALYGLVIYLYAYSFWIR
ncbi:MAG: hypothetical protein RML93_03290 [Anaerolineales bacterium]|nr:hypothetical protein [Anaerolineales bacterium]MCS7247798.1 hypothetical protein [Anaerolineales bacterium]MDW8161608.1 hypothetical protein [Anaerolineales bacterium]MDW8446298.1 hypothetical protein [Anaerolineales bacterium]